VKARVRHALVPVTARTLGAIHRALYRASGGRIVATIWGLPIVLLTTTGRRSGKPRTTPLCAWRTGDTFVVIASFGGMDHPPRWWLNLQAAPAASLQVGREHIAVTARTTSGDERAQLWSQVVERAPGYLGYARRTAREIPVIVLEPRRR
jgi:deazaflavin-dependent oxidoreductase (nitroreductase family)